ncbi:ribosomal protection-like ABC-F family protein [Aquibacillus kalidii]|uniref:ribosomal protection-like ABC-F family protein n=1 Tax=Aquibacillus kalidii TaxID=2762597 RepID=UPI0016444C42|nr:ABC-F family ATP-binding cassette domain-containing protein [Aquibacillus kalidii]
MLVTLKDIKKISGGNVLFEKLNFDIKENEKVGLVGRNGSGKTTIFKLIAGIEQFEQGNLFIKRNTKIGYLEQIPDFPEGTALDFLQNSFEEINDLKKKMKQLEEKMQSTSDLNKVLEDYGKVQTLFTDKGGYEVDAKIDKVAHGLAISHLLSQSFTQLSGGEKTKVGLAKILLQEPDLLLLDEPTNHLDLAAIEWLEKYVNQYEGSVCIVSHDRTFLDNSVGKIADVEMGEITYYRGNYSQYEKMKEEKLLQEFAAYQEQQKKIKKIKEAIRRLRQWANEANPPNEKLFKKAKSMERALERLEKLDRPIMDPKTMALNFSAEDRSGKDVLKAECLTKNFGDKSILKGIDLHLRYKDRLALVGDNGSGKSTLIKLLLEKDIPTSGSVTVGSQVSIGYLPQDPMRDVAADLPMIDYFRSEIKVTEAEARQILAKFMFYGYSVFQKVSHLSGGERMRVKLAIFMYLGVNVLVLDEPTNHLDVESQEVLEEALEKFDGTVIGISHDRYFLNQCFTETAYLVDGKLHRYVGNYDETKSNWEHLKDRLIAVQQKQKEKPMKTGYETKIDYELEIEKLESRIANLKVKIQQGENKGREVELAEEKLDLYFQKWMEEDEHTV